MPAIQTTYATTHARWVEGMVLNMEPSTIVTRLAIRRMPFNIAATIASLDDPTIGDVIAALCAQATDERYALSFTPF